MQAGINKNADWKTNCRMGQPADIETINSNTNGKNNFFMQQHFLNKKAKITSEAVS
jgi:hypothetical protein